MSKSIKLKDNNYIDSTSVVHNRTKLNEIINSVWKPLPLTSNWGAFDNNTFNAPSYCIRGNMVCLKGLLKRNANMVRDETITTLPVGFRPPKRVLISSLCGSQEIQRLDIHNTGEIKTPYTVHESNMLSLENIFFYID